MRNVELEVTGMGCESCATAVRSALESVEGVRRAEVSLESRRARTLLEDGVDETALIEAVEAAGYGASVAA